MSFYDSSVHRNVVVAIMKVDVVSPPRNSNFASKLRFKIVCNSHFYDPSMHRKVALAIIKVGWCLLPEMAE